VHALINTCHVDLTHADNITPDSIISIMNSYMTKNNCADDLRIISVQRVSDHYNARFCTYERTYMYRVIENCSKQYDADIMNHPFLAKRAYFIRRETPMDLERMREAAKILEGEHDFSSFCKLSSVKKNRKDPVRCIDKFQITEHDLPEFIKQSFVHKRHQVREIRFHITGKSFLHHQVRYMVEAVMRVGDGNWTLKKLKEILENRIQIPSLHLIPGYGLYLCEIKDCESMLSNSNKQISN